MDQRATENPPRVVDDEMPAFLRRNDPRPGAAGTDEPPPSAGDEIPAEAFEDDQPPYKAHQDEVRAAEQQLEREASGHTAEEVVGANDRPLIVGDIATVTFGTGKTAYDKTGTLLALEAGNARVRLIGSKDPLGEWFPAARVATIPINGGKPLKGKGEQKKAAEHALRVKEYTDAVEGGAQPRPGEAARPSDGFAHAHRAADDEETAPLPKRVLKGHNQGLSDATIYRHLGTVRAAKAKVASATGELRERIKKAKDDGVDTKILNRIMDELKLSPEELISEQNALHQYRTAVSLPSAGPVQEDEEDRESPAKRKAYARQSGSQAGYRGSDMSTNPYPDATDPCHEEWNTGWREAQNKLASKFRVLEK